jgi:hypothetical protein
MRSTTAATASSWPRTRPVKKLRTEARSSCCLVSRSYAFAALVTADRGEIIEGTRAVIMRPFRAAAPGDLEQRLRRVALGTSYVAGVDSVSLIALSLLAIAGHAVGLLGHRVVTICAPRPMAATRHPQSQRRLKPWCSAPALCHVQTWNATSAPNHPGRKCASGDVLIALPLASNPADRLHDFAPTAAHRIESKIILRRAEAGMDEAQPRAAIHRRERPRDDTVEPRTVGGVIV